VTSEHGQNSQGNVIPEVPEQAGKILSQFAGYVGFKTIEMGLANGLLEALNSHPDDYLPTNWPLRPAQRRSTRESGQSQPTVRHSSN
jgi:hypothetical protein